MFTGGYMGKKVKKALGDVVKVASLGAIGPGGWGGEAVSVLSGGLIGGSPKMGSGADTGAALAQALTEQANRAQNANADLSLDNVATVETAGTANALSGSQKKRRNAAGGSGLSASLGINVG